MSNAPTSPKASTPRPRPSSLLKLAVWGCPVSWVTLAVFTFFTNTYFLPGWANTLMMAAYLLPVVSFIASIACLFLVSARGDRRPGRWRFVAGSVWGILSSLVGFAIILQTLGGALPAAQGKCYAAQRVSAALTDFAERHSGAYPPCQAAAIRDQSQARDAFNYSMSSWSPPPWKTIESDVDNSSSFIYTGADLTSDQLLTLGPPLNVPIIVAYSKKLPDVPGGRILIFTAYQRTELVADADLPSAFAASNAARAKLHLQPFSLDGPPPIQPQSTSSALESKP